MTQDIFLRVHIKKRSGLNCYLSGKQASETYGCLKWIILALQASNSRHCIFA